MQVHVSRYNFMEKAIKLMIILTQLQSSIFMCNNGHFYPRVCEQRESIREVNCVRAVAWEGVLFLALQGTRLMNNL